MNYEMIVSDLFHFIANRTQEGVLKVNNVEQVTFLKNNGNVMMVGIFDKDVSNHLYINCRVKQNLYLNRMSCVIEIACL